jgi:putative ABC transport system permease protein
MRTVLLASLRVHSRRYLAAALAVTVGVSFVVVTAAISSAARAGMLSGVAAPFEGADVVADGLSGEEAARLVEGAADVGAEATVLGWTMQPVMRDGDQLADDVDVAQIATSPGCAGRPSRRDGFRPARARRRLTSTRPRARTSPSATGSGSAPAQTRAT